MMVEDLNERVSYLEAQVKGVQAQADRCMMARAKAESDMAKSIKEIKLELAQMRGALSIIKWGIGVLIAVAGIIAAKGI